MDIVNLEEISEMLKSGILLQIDYTLDNIPDSLDKSIIQGEIIQEQGNYAESLAIAEGLHQIQHSADDIEKHVAILNLLTFSSLKLGLTDKAVEYNSEAYQFLVHNPTAINDFDSISMIYHLRGLIFRSLGNYSEALNSYYTSLTIREKYQRSFLAAKTKNNIGVVYRNLGDFKASLKYLFDSISVFEELELDLIVGLVLMNIAIVYDRSQDNENAEKYFLRSYETLQRANNQIELSDLLYYFCMFYIKLGEFDKVKNLLESLQSLDASRSELIGVRQKVILASYLKEQQRFRDVGEALDLFKEVIDADVIDGALSLTATINYCDLLLREYQVFGSKTLEEDILWTLFKIDDMTKFIQSPFVKCQVLFLRGKFHLLLGQFDKASDLLMLVEQMIEQHGFVSLGQQLRIRDIQQLLIQRQQNGESAREPTEFVLQEINNSLHSMINLSEDHNFDHEIPVSFMIIGKNGTLKFSTEFGSTFHIEKNLIGSFLTAINYFINGISSTEGNLEKIEHADMKFAFKWKQSVIFCYMFQQDSPHVYTKLDMIIDKIRSDQAIWENLSDNYSFPDEDMTQKIEGIVTGIIFTS